jgi:hypothetical protein
MQDYGRNALVWCAAALTAAAAAAVFAINSMRVERARDVNSVLHLEATEANGHIRLSWDPRQARVQRASSATLEVRDGDNSGSYPVDTQVLRRGSLDYVHRSDDVLLTLTLVEDGMPGSRGMLRAISALTREASVTAPATAERSRLTKKGKAASFKKKSPPRKKSSRARSR